MKQGSAILMVVLFLSITTIYLVSLLDTSGHLVEVAKMRQQEIKKTYAAEGLARVGIQALKQGALKPVGNLNYLDGTITTKAKSNSTILTAIYEGKMVEVKLSSKDFKIIMWKFL